MCKRKESGKLLAIPAALTLFLLPSVTSTELVQGTVIGKSFFFAYALCAVGVACILVNATEANAECPPGNVKNGRCNAMGTWCYLTPFEEDQDCDFYYNNRQF